MSQSCFCLLSLLKNYRLFNHIVNMIYLIFQKGQLGRPILDVPYWNAKPAPMPNIGSKYGRKATWIGASGDQTFLRIDEALINSHVLATSEIFASKHIIGNTQNKWMSPPKVLVLINSKQLVFPYYKIQSCSFCFLSV